MSSVMFVFVLLSATFLSNMFANLFKALSVASPNSKYGVLGLGCSFRAVVRYFSAWQIWSTEFVVGI